MFLSHHGTSYVKIIETTFREFSITMDNRKHTLCAFCHHNKESAEADSYFTLTLYSVKELKNIVNPLFCLFVINL